MGSPHPQINSGLQNNKTESSLQDSPFLFVYFRYSDKIFVFFIETCLEFEKFVSLIKNSGLPEITTRNWKTGDI